ncbi:MAG: serine hydrolase, partial [Candidatus Nanopelagicales bacterium]
MTKPYTTVAALRLSEQGQLDLDAPVHAILDPWLSKHGQPTLMELWKGHEAEISVVTSRMLLSMQSGMPDYNSHQLQLWTLEHPADDFLPLQFLQNVSKEFLFPPGEGGAYSGDGYVLMGLVLAAVLDANDWSDLDQLQLTFGQGAAE